MSALHRVKDGTKYPAIFLTTGANDRRIDVWQSTKMAARLQSATASGKPVLLPVDLNAGHRAGAQAERSITNNLLIFTLFYLTVPATVNEKSFSGNKKSETFDYSF